MKIDKQNAWKCAYLRMDSIKRNTLIGLGIIVAILAGLSSLVSHVHLVLGWS